MGVSSQHRRELPWVDPIDAAELTGGFLLDGRGQHPESQYAFIGLNPIEELRLEGGNWRRLARPDGWEVVEEVPATPDYLSDYANSMRQEISEEYPFTGGIIGYFGYEAARIFEPTLPGQKADVPDAILSLCTDALVFDYAQGKLVAFAYDDLDLANARLDDLSQLLASPVNPAQDVPETDWKTSLNQADFESAVTRVKQLINNGDLFQANIATRFSGRLNARPVDVFRRLTNGNPSPYMALLPFDGWSLVSSSPEQLFVVSDGKITTRPIAGTRSRGSNPDADEALEAELVSDPKERAEHTMLVDLLRNDIAKVSQPGTTRVAEAFSVERYQHVMHLVSCIQGTLQPSAGFVDWMRALFPGGTITGAPKHRACLRINEVEPVARGPYTGSAGFLSWSHNATWNILIRTLVMKDGEATVHAGSGIVADSQPTAEWHEAGRKAASLLRAGGGNTTRLGEVSKHGQWQPPEPNRTVAARVLLIDNFDSFVYNLADYAAMAGATVRTIRNDSDLPTALAAFEPTHIIIGPGPGWPDESGCSLAAARISGTPILGVCLGHQALAQEYGGRVYTVAPVHGKTARVTHDDELFAGINNPITATRYHSLAVEIPPGWKKIAWLDDGMVMGMRHPNAPIWGLQFHPESFSTEHGLEIMLNFLESKWTA